VRANAAEWINEINAVTKANNSINEIIIFSNYAIINFKEYSIKFYLDTIFKNYIEQQILPQELVSAITKHIERHPKFTKPYILCINKNVINYKLSNEKMNMHRVLSIETAIINFSYYIVI
jgi:hypothetical protein